MPLAQKEQYLDIDYKQQFLICFISSIHYSRELFKLELTLWQQTTPPAKKKKACVQDGVTKQHFTLKDYNFHKDMIYTKQKIDQGIILMRPVSWLTDKDPGQLYCDEQTVKQRHGIRHIGTQYTGDLV